MRTGQINHVGEKPMKTTIEQNGITFVNVPAMSCNCGENVTLTGEQIAIVEALANRLITVLNGESMTVDFEQVNSDLAGDILRERSERLDAHVRFNPPRRVTGKSLAELEEMLVKHYDDPSGEECK